MQYFEIMYIDYLIHLQQKVIKYGPK